MKLAEGVEWAIHSCLLMAGLRPGRVLPAAKLAEYHEVPAPYLAKQLQALAARGLVEAAPGRRGGYRLGRPLAGISLLDIVLAVEGEDTAFRCTEIRRRGPCAGKPASYGSVCAVASAMWRAEAIWRRELAATTLSDLLAAVPARSSPPDRTSAWIEMASHPMGELKRKEHRP